MSDKITEVTEKSWGSRIMDSIKGVAIGALLFIASFPVLWMNEGCAVRTARGLEEGAGNVISVSADTVETANNGKLVHLSGEAKTDEVLKTQFSTSAPTPSCLSAPWKCISGKKS
jgi:hypothetical protein